MRSFQTFGEILQYVEENYSRQRAFNHLEEGSWKHLSTENFIFDVKRLTYGLISLGLNIEDNVGILALSVPRWNIADFAIIMAGGVTVPIFPRISEESFIYEVAQANIRFLFVQGKDQWEMYQQHRNLFEKVIGLDEFCEAAGALKYQDILQEGEVLWQQKPNLWDELLERQRGDDVVTIIYTSGTMGVPKGVEHTHKSLCHLVNNQPFGKIEDDIFLSILPLPHIFARQISLVLIAWGTDVYYLNDVGKFAKVCRTLKPTLMSVVPRILEKMYETMENTVLRQKNKLKRWIGIWALNLAKGSSLSFLNREVLRPIADLLVYSSIRHSLGGKWRAIISGGAALDPELSRFFISIGLPVYEGWGLTEGSIAAANSPTHIKVGTVGRPIPGLKVVIGKNKEVLLGGASVMKGYYRNPAATKEALDEEGWLHTGDKGKIDNEGFLSLIGRVKEQFKLSSGEYVAPSHMENLLCHHSLIGLAMVIGERRKYPCCLLFPEKGVLKRIKKEQKAESLSDEEFLLSPYVEQEMAALLDTVNSRTNSWEKLYRYRFILEIPTIEKGELTPTLKLRRRVILGKYRDLIDELYQEETR